MGLETINKIRDSEIHGDFVGRDKTINIIMFKDKEREFVITRNANIKPVSYFTGRETEIRDLRQRIEEGRKSVGVLAWAGLERRIFVGNCLRNTLRYILMVKIVLSNISAILSIVGKWQAVCKNV